jgi:hypothetical protein
MPKSVTVIAAPLLLMTVFIVWQALQLAATTSSFSTPGRQANERMASPTPPATPKLVSSAMIEQIEPAISPRTLLLEHFTFEQFARYELPPHAGAIVMVETGQLRVKMSRAASKRAMATVETSDPMGGPSFIDLAAGQSFAAPSRATVMLANLAMEPAKVFLLTIPPYDPADEQWAPVIPNPLPAGVTREMRISGPTILAYDGPLALDMNLVQVSPEPAVASHLVTGSALLLVDTGRVAVQMRNGNVMRRPSDQPAVDWAGTTVLSPQQAIILLDGAEAAYRANGNYPATIVVVAVSETDPQN